MTFFGLRDDKVPEAAGSTLAKSERKPGAISVKICQWER
jgi:hypothetical protein